MLPPWLFELPTLGILDIRGTPLTHLPKELANCQSLLTLKLDKDRFTYPRKRILEEGMDLAVRACTYVRAVKAMQDYSSELLGGLYMDTEEADCSSQC